MSDREDTIEFRILGPFEVSERGQPLDVGAGKQRALLALLLLRAGEVVSTDRLIDALWEDRPPASALNSVHVYVSQLRKALGNGRLQTREHGYLLELAPEQVDLGRFERLLGEGRELLASGDAERAAETLAAALGLWRGPPLSDFASAPFAQDEIARLEELHLAALEERIEADLALGRDAELIPSSRRSSVGIPCVSVCALSSCSRCTGQAASRRRSRRISRAAGCSRRSSASSRAAACRSCRARSCDRTRGSTRPPGPPPGSDGLDGDAACSSPLGAVVLLSVTAAVGGMTLIDDDDAGPAEVLPNSLVRIDPSTLKPTDVVPIGDAPDHLVVAGGFVWVMHHVLRDTDSARPPQCR